MDSASAVRRWIVTLEPVPEDDEEVDADASEMMPYFCWRAGLMRCGLSTYSLTGMPLVSFQEPSSVWYSTPAP